MRQRCRIADLHGNDTNVGDGRTVMRALAILALVVLAACSTERWPKAPPCGPFDMFTGPDGHLWTCVDASNPHWERSSFRSRPGDPGYDCCGPSRSCEACR